jgi:peptidoglycan-associated lipoprotein
MKMRKRFFVFLTLMLIFPLSLATVSCGKKTIKSEPVVTRPAEDDAQRRAAERARQEELERQNELERQRRIAEERLSQESKAKEEALSRKTEPAAVAFSQEDIYFDYDSAVLSAAAQEVLKKKAEYLRSKGSLTIIIEGHCDERGTAEYNLALGDRRAEAAKSFLVAMGISGNRISTISFGEERPADRGRTEEAWARNRRAHFVIE